MINEGNRSFAVLGLPRMISCVVYEWSPLRLSHGISCGVPGISFPIRPFRNLLRVEITVPSPTFSALVCLSPLVRKGWPMAMIVGSIPTTSVLVTAAGRRHPAGW
jgi:hypothetical protein